MNIIFKPKKKPEKIVKREFPIKVRPGEIIIRQVSVLEKELLTSIRDEQKKLARDFLALKEEATLTLIGLGAAFLFIAAVLFYMTRNLVKRVDALGTGLHWKGQQSAPEVKKILNSFLRDENHHVRANAAKVLYLVDPQFALSLLNRMMEEDNNWMKMSAARVLGEIGTPEAARILIKNIAVPDENTKKTILSSLRKILDFDSREKDFPASAIEDIEKAFQNVQTEEGWVA